MPRLSMRNLAAVGKNILAFLGAVVIARNLFLSHYTFDQPVAVYRAEEWNYRESIDTAAEGNLKSANRIAVRFNKDQKSAVVPVKQPPVHHLISNISASMSDHSHSTKVLIVAYYRGGSSFLGSLLSENHDTFYYFEPFFYPFRAYKERNILTSYGDIYINENGSFQDLKPTMDKWIPKATVALLSCNFLSKDVHPRMLMTNFVLGPYVKGRQIKLLSSYRFCMNHLEKNQTRDEFKKSKMKIYFERFPECVNHLIRSCSRHKVTVLKSIRMTLQQAHSALNSDSDIKVIYSTRDPRGVAASRDYIMLGVQGAPTLSQQTAEVCERIRHDLHYAKVIEEQYPGRFYKTSFESIVKETVKESKKIYDFLGLEIPVEVETLIKNEETQNIKETFKTAPSKWLSRFSENEKETARKQCEDVFQMLRIK